MPPAKGSKKRAIATKNNDAGSDAAPEVDLSGVTPAEDAVAQRLAYQNNLKKSARLGYAKVDFLALDVNFGEWNPRPVEPATVKHHLESFC